MSWKIASVALLGLICSIANGAEGISPTQPVVIVEQSKKLSSTIIENTGSEPLLLITQIYSLEKDQGVDITASPKLIRIEPGSKQIVRFILNSPELNGVQHLMRVKFEGVPLKDKTANSRVNLAHDLPILINPVGLRLEAKPWKDLVIKSADGGIHVSNPSSYVVRLIPSARLGEEAKLQKINDSYILPNSQIFIPNTDKTSLVLFPAGVYGENVPEVRLTESGN